MCYVICRKGNILKYQQHFSLSIFLYQLVYSLVFMLIILLPRCIAINIVLQIECHLTCVVYVMQFVLIVSIPDAYRSLHKTDLLDLTDPLS